MSERLISPPRLLRAEKPVRLVLVNGFLGAGKTTAMVALGHALQIRGLRVAVVTNDQAIGLVDTGTIRQAGLPVREVAGGCFCCRFTDLLEAVQALLEDRPDVLLCEAVGSCTDMVATVINPLRRFYPRLFQIAPFTALTDPQRVREIVLNEGNCGFPPEVAYIFHKQLEEADLIALNKTDTLTEAEAERLAQALSGHSGRPVLPLSAVSGEGMDAWLERLLSDARGGEYRLRKVDYNTYAAGEAVLGWLNATARVQGSPSFEAGRFAATLMDSFRRECSGRAEIAHLKLSLTGDGPSVRANLTASNGLPAYHGAGDGEMGAGVLTLNARVGTDPETLADMAKRLIEQAAASAGASARVTALQSFRPGYPDPPYRMTEDVA